MDIKILNTDGSESSTLALNDNVFGVAPNESIVHQAIVKELSDRRQGTHSAKSRGMVSGGGRKPFKQKGRGAARAGSIRSPLWKGGGTVFGPTPHMHFKDMPKKMRQLARKCVLSNKATNNEILVIEDFGINEKKTALVKGLLQKLGVAGKKITLMPAVLDENLFISARNIPNVEVVRATQACTYDLINNDLIIFDKAGISLLNSQLGTEGKA